MDLYVSSPHHEDIKPAVSAESRVWLCLPPQSTLWCSNNESKLLLYTRFQWALIACVAATIVFAAWTITEHLKVNADDEPDWRNQWWLEGYVRLAVFSIPLNKPLNRYWHLLFFCILVVIMYLWRPTQNNQRYAYSALENGDEEEEEFEVREMRLLCALLALLAPCFACLLADLQALAPPMPLMNTSSRLCRTSSKTR